MLITRPEAEKAYEVLKDRCPGNSLTHFIKNILDTIPEKHKSHISIDEYNPGAIKVTWNDTDLLESLSASGYEPTDENLSVLKTYLDTDYMADCLIETGNLHINSAIGKCSTLLTPYEREND